MRHIAIGVLFAFIPFAVSFLLYRRGKCSIWPVLLTAPEAALKAIDEIGNDYNGTIQKVNMEFEADGQFK